LDFARPVGTELEDSEAEALEGHLADCPDCGALASQERRLDNHLGQVMRAVEVPVGLRDRLLTKLAAERDAWYRRWLLRGVGVAALAAAILLLVWVGLSSLRPEVELEAIVNDLPRPGFTPEAVEQWFLDERNVRTFAPSANDVNYIWLNDYDLQEFGSTGKRVPMLLFTYTGNDRRDQAKVYILKDTEFKSLKDLEAQAAKKGSKGYDVKVLQNRDHPHFYYVVLYTEGSGPRFFVTGKINA
jgi:hypothetical protein